MADSGDTGSRGLSPVVGVALMVVIVVLLATVLGGLALGYDEKLGGPRVQTAMEFEQTSTGILVSPSSIGQSVTVNINDVWVADYDPGDAGKATLLPVAPGDQVLIRATDDDRSVVVRRAVSQGEAGDFVAFYAFDGSGSTLEDASANTNDGTFEHDPQWVTHQGRTGLRFDGNDDRVVVPDIDTGDTDVEAFTMAATFRLTGDEDSINQIVEHRAADGTERYMETDSAPGSGEYVVDFAVNYPSHVITSGPLTVGETHTVVGTYDGETYAMYVDGTKVSSGTYDSDVALADLSIGRDYETNHQHFDGDVYEMRLYYEAFSGDDAELLSEVMNGEVSE